MMGSVGRVGIGEFGQLSPVRSVLCSLRISVNASCVAGLGRLKERLIRASERNAIVVCGREETEERERAKE